MANKSREDSTNILKLKDDTLATVPTKMTAGLR